MIKKDMFKESFNHKYSLKKICSLIIVFDLNNPVIQSAIH